MTLWRSWLWPAVTAVAGTWIFFTLNQPRHLRFGLDLPRCRGWGLAGSHRSVSTGGDEGSVNSRLRIPRNSPSGPHQTCQVPESMRVFQTSETFYGFCFESRSRNAERSIHSVKPRPYVLLRDGDLRWRRFSEAVEGFLKYGQSGESYINFTDDKVAPELNPEYVPDLLVDRVRLADRHPRLHLELHPRYCNIRLPRTCRPLLWRYSSHYE